MDNGFTIWMTGLSAAGKSTLANLLAARLRERGIHHLEVLDGDEVREHLSKGLGFSREDRDTNIARIAYVCKLLTRNGSVAISAAISPYREAREKARAEIGNFVEVYVRCPIDVLAARDPKGLYKKALAGEIANFTGISDPYEEPLEPEVVLDTDRESAEASVHRIVEVLEAKGFLQPLTLSSAAVVNGVADQAEEDVYSTEEEEIVTQRLKDLGYL